MLSPLIDVQQKKGAPSGEKKPLGYVRGKLSVVPKVRLGVESIVFEQAFPALCVNMIGISLNDLAGIDGLVLIVYQETCFAQQRHLYLCHADRRRDICGLSFHSCAFFVN